MVNAVWMLHSVENPSRSRLAREECEDGSIVLMMAPTLEWGR